MQARNKPVVLLVAEAVTLAHFARIVTLAKALDPDLYEVVVASDPRYLDLETPLGCAFHPIHSIPSAEFARALAKGQALYSVETLTRYVEDDLELLDRVQPDLVIGDFRLSLAVSAPLRHIPYAAVVNAYWSPYADVGYPVPDLPMTRILGVKLAQKLFDLMRPAAFALHARPLNQVRQRFGLVSLGYDLRNVYTWGDYTLYADLPGFITMRTLPPNHRFIGPVMWSTKTPLPDWWDSLPSERPVVFVGLGSSGDAAILPRVLAALAKLPVSTIVATAGRVRLGQVPVNAFVADYLPIDAASRRAQLVICNGGSLSTYQALANGVPVLGICSNMDQMLNMNAVERLGAGLARHAFKLTAAELTASVSTLLGQSSFAVASRKIGHLLSCTDYEQLFGNVVVEVLRGRKGS